MPLLKIKARTRPAARPARPMRPSVVESRLPVASDSRIGSFASECCSALAKELPSNSGGTRVNQACQDLLRTAAAGLLGRGLGGGLGGRGGGHEGGAGDEGGPDGGGFPRVGGDHVGRGVL